ncbi:hypothetical protein [Nocardia flavorosea]|uniref:hypothetical protein n=1 Tax=Nocardia flavorosea TaxID=53429 RepID=UPI0024580A0E|nr:hypothetical protein [Nocardia flavorosea]
MGNEVEHNETGRRSAGPGARAKQRRAMWLGAAAGVVIVSAVLVGWSVADQILPGMAGVVALSAALDIAIAFGAAAVLTLVVWAVLRRRGRWFSLYLWVVSAGLILLSTRGAGTSATAWYLTVASAVVGASLVGAGAGMLLCRDTSRMPRRPIAVSAVGILVFCLPGSWLVAGGQPAPSADAVVAGVDGGAPGPLAVETAVYGSGTDRRAPYDSAGVDLRTEPVDASAIVSGWDDRRVRHWGFDADRFPLNAQVWYPVSDLPAPLVLIVHGNSSAATASEAGFGYLGRYLASHGFVVAALDENFLNTGPLDRSGGLGGVDHARGWLILEHLKVWQDWAGEPGHRLGSRVDMSRIGLAGHSRGGEAITTADELNAGAEAPGFAIRSLFALAPTEGLYEPQAVRSADTDYVVLQGAQDADVIGFGGLDQWARVAVGDGVAGLKGAVIVEGLNHAQFNSRWGSYDIGNGLPKHFIDTGRLVSAKQQQHIAAAWALATFRATLGDDPAARAALITALTAPRDADRPRSARRAITSGTTPAAEVTSAGDGEFQEVPLPLRGAPGAEIVHSVRWEAGDAAPTVTARFPGGVDLGVARLVFDAGSRLQPVDVRIRVTDTAGRTATLPAAVRVGGPLDTEYLRWEWMQPVAATQPLPQTYAVEVSPEVMHAAGVNPTAVSSVDLVFPADTAGSVLLGPIGLRPE